MGSFRAVILSLTLLSQFYGGFGQYASSSWGNTQTTAARNNYPGNTYYGWNGNSVAPGRVDTNRYSRISCRENAINYDCLFKDVHIEENEAVSTDRFSDYGLPHASAVKSLAFTSSTVRRLPAALLDTFRNTVLLNLQDLQLRTIDRDAFAYGEQLQQLYLSSNGLTQLEQGVFDSLRAMNVIMLNRNHLSFLPEGLFYRNEMLLSVSITHNSLTRIEDSTFAYNRYLESVNVSSNSIEHFDLSRLTTAFEIDVSHNRLRQVKIPTELRRLFASHNHIDRIVTIGQNRKLKVLDLSNNKLTTVSWASMYSELEELDLGHNEIEDVQHVHFPAQIKLKKLLLNNNRLFTFDLSNGRLRQLQVLDLSYNQLTYVDSNSKIFDRLQQLYLHNNAIVTLRLSANNSLQNISLSNNDWDCANLRTQLALIDPSAIRDANESSCPQGYIIERRLCCKETKIVYLDRLLVAIRQRNVFELAKRNQCDDYQNAVVDIDMLNAALATASVQSLETLRSEVSELQSIVVSLSVEKQNTEQLLDKVNHNLIVQLGRYGAGLEGLDTPLLMVNELITRLENRHKLLRNQTIEKKEKVQLMKKQKDEHKATVDSLEIALNNKKAFLTMIGLLIRAFSTQ
ncbi:leucine-rich repeats and immunoglobulin-like domains protein sma-10 [Anopheles darlingi]|uniref:leucine-rich repeats and immunoglobulin-like domains protein sma-10 n=1 Tax=Anopheles darlingi TaxID=43151 RepID=UPI002100112D|nr:leucine-rich repeats and immunoglobulin-like domains protein sma-10 [Anopheles darlingi]